MTAACEIEHCIGCNACIAVCAFDAMEKAEYNGFLYNKIIWDKCIGCGKCQHVCPVNANKEIFSRNNRSQTFYAVKIRRERMKSQSGGAIWAFAIKILEQGGIIYGCEQTKNLNINYARYDNFEKAKSIRKVKYVQANCDTDIFIDVKRDLEQDRMVLFTGTPCQIAGLKNYLSVLEVDMKNFFTVDIICHGVPSPVIYENYINYLEKKYQREISTYVFRDKSFGWGSHIETICFKNYGKKHVDMWKQLFYSGRIIRKACGNCKYSCMERVSDITVGDCWNIYSYNRKFWDKKGISTVIINTEKGHALYNMSCNNFISLKIDKKTVMQHNLNHSTDLPSDYDRFWEEYNQNGFKYVYKKYVVEREVTKLRFNLSNYMNGFKRRLKK